MRTHPMFFALLLAAALVAPAGAATRSRPATARGPLPWIANDYPKAVALAKARHVPIFVENWAPW